jgi:uncharacterized protein YpmS
MAKKKKRKIWLWILMVIAGLLIAFIFYFKLVTRIEPPTELDPLEMGYKRKQLAPGVFTSGTSWLKQNSY